MSDVGPEFAAEVIISSDPAEARRVQDEITRRLHAHRFSEPEIFGIRLALEEALVNAIRHGNHLDRQKHVVISYQVRSDRFEILISDEGGGFNPCAVPDPTTEENLERPCGRGLMLMRHYMNDVTFNPQGNCVCMTKLRNGRSP